MFFKCSVSCIRLFLSSVILSLILGSVASFGGELWTCLGCFEEYELDYQNKEMWQAYPLCKNKKCDHSFPNCPKKIYDGLVYKEKYIIPPEVKADIQILMMGRGLNNTNKMKIPEYKVETQQKEQGIKKSVKVCDFYEGIGERFIEEMQITMFKIFLVEAAAAATHEKLEEGNMSEEIKNIYKKYTNGTNNSCQFVITERLSIANFIQSQMNSKRYNISTLLSVGSEVDEEGRYQQQTDNIVQYIFQQLFNHSLIMVSYGSQAHDSSKEDSVYTKMRQEIINFCNNNNIEGVGHTGIIYNSLNKENYSFWEKCINGDIENLADELDYMKDMIIAKGHLIVVNRSGVIMFSKIRSLKSPTFLCRKVEESSENIKTCKIKWCFGQMVVEMDPTNDGIHDVQNIIDKMAESENNLQKYKNMIESMNQIHRMESKGMIIFSAAFIAVASVYSYFNNSIRYTTDTILVCGFVYGAIVFSNWAERTIKRKKWK